MLALPPNCSYDHTSSDDQRVLHVTSTAHVIHAFINDVFVGKWLCEQISILY